MDNFVCILQYVVAAGQDQFADTKFAQCLQKCFHLHELCDSLNLNVYSITIIKQN